jgi:hypothetical protein
MHRCTLPAFLALGSLVIGIAGCTSTGGGADRPKYFEPEPGGVGRATLRGAPGIYVQGVDGARVGSADVRNIGNNVVFVSAGMRNIRVTRQGIKSQSWDFDFTCEKGHTYEFSKVGTFDGRLKVTDVTVGDSLIISDDDIAAAW